MATTNIKGELQKLVELQELDIKIYAFAKEKAESPKILENLQGRTGLDVAAEQALWLRKQEREALVMQSNIRKMRNEIGNTDFGLPFLICSTSCLMKNGCIVVYPRFPPKCILMQIFLLLNLYYLARGAAFLRQT